MIWDGLDVLIGGTRHTLAWHAIFCVPISCFDWLFLCGWRPNITITSLLIYHFKCYIGVFAVAYCVNTPMVIAILHRFSL